MGHPGARTVVGEPVQCGPEAGLGVVLALPGEAPCAGAVADHSAVEAVDTAAGNRDRITVRMLQARAAVRDLIENGAQLRGVGFATRAIAEASQRFGRTGRGAAIESFCQGLPFELLCDADENSPHLGDLEVTGGHSIE